MEISSTGTFGESFRATEAAWEEVLNAKKVGGGRLELEGRLLRRRMRRLVKTALGRNDQ